MCGTAGAAAVTRLWGTKERKSNLVKVLGCSRNADKDFIFLFAGASFELFRFSNQRTWCYPVKRNIFGIFFEDSWPRFFSDMRQCAKRKIRVVGQALIGAVQSITDVNCTNLILHWPLTRN